MRRPISVTIFGVLNIILAVLGVLRILPTRLSLFVNMETSVNPVVKIMREHPVYLFWMKAMTPLGLLSCAVLLIAGIGLLGLKEWGRKTSLGYAIYAIVFGILSGVINFVFLFGPLFASARHQQGPEAIGAMLGVMSGILGEIFGMIYRILLLTFMTRPKVKRAFRHSTPPDLVGID